MDQTSLMATIMVVAIQTAIIALAVGSLLWWLYRRASRESEGFKSEKHHLARRRTAHLRFLKERLHSLAMRRNRGNAVETELERLERRILEEDKRHTEAAEERDKEIWDLRTSSTRTLIDAVRAMDLESPALTPDRHRSSETQTSALRRALQGREEQVEQQKRQISEMSPFRDAWMRLHRHARRESKENAALKDALRRLPADAGTAGAIRNVLDTYANDRAALDDYLEATAATFEEANPDQARRARVRQRRLNRTHAVLDNASSRIDALSQNFPAVLHDQSDAINDLESKLEHFKHAKEVLQQNYTREIKRLKQNNHEAENHARGLERENRRLRLRVRNLIQMNEEDTMLFVPGTQSRTSKNVEQESAQKNAELDRALKALQQERKRCERAEAQLEKYKSLEAAIQSTLEPAQNPASK